MSPQSNDRDVDLDRQISEQDARIRTNPRDAVAYRERGFFHARKHDLDHALKDLNQAVLLNPKDPRAFGLRGLVLHALKEDIPIIVPGRRWQNAGRYPRAGAIVLRRGQVTRFGKVP